jgi:hypothetical protein
MLQDVWSCLRALQYKPPMCPWFGSLSSHTIPTRVSLWPVHDLR